MIMMIDGVNAVVLAREFGLPTISSIASSGRLGTTSGSAKAIYYYLHIPSIYTDEPEISDESQL